MLYDRYRFLGGIKHFWIAVRVWKTNHVLEDLIRQKRTKMWPKWGLSYGLIDVWLSEWSVVSWIWITKPSTTILPRNWACNIEIIVSLTYTINASLCLLMNKVFYSIGNFKSYKLYILYYNFSVNRKYHSGFTLNLITVYKEYNLLEKADLAQ